MRLKTWTSIQKAFKYVRTIWQAEDALLAPSADMCTYPYLDNTLAPVLVAVAVVIAVVAEVEAEDVAVVVAVDAAAAVAVKENARDPGPSRKPVTNGNKKESVLGGASAYTNTTALVLARQADHRSEWRAI